MDQQILKDLIDKVNQGNASPEELGAYNAYLNQAIKGDGLAYYVQPEEEEALKAELMQRIAKEIGHKPVRRLWPRIAAAASIILAISAGGYFLSTSHRAAQHLSQMQEILPGKNTATLTLSNGRRIILSTRLKGQLALQSGVNIDKTSSGELVYTVNDKQTARAGNYNTLTTARGEQYQVILPDGTHVWLNAATSLKYPVSFANTSQRKVELNGEAYFEVAKDKSHPFVVKTVQQEVEVLGTHFNINSYNDEPVTKTTLLEGSVQITENQGTMVKIKPGEQASLKDGKMKISDADVDATIAWKNGQFLFNDEALSAIMRKISRWYDVEIVYQEGVNPGQSFFGGVSRYDNISKVLSKLEHTGGINFKIEGRRIIIGK